MRALLLLLAFTAAAPGCQNQVDSSEGDGPDLQVARGQVELLPFRVRLSRVAQVAGVATDDPLLETMRAHALELGDHDFASGVRPDLRWTSSRMGIWVKSLLPVCDAEAVQARYPSLADDPGELITAAYGREPTGDDLAAVDEALVDLTDPAERFRATCLAILSSVEFVAR